MGDTLKIGSLLWYVTGWTGDGKPTRIESAPVLGQTPRRWVLRADDMLWKAPKSGGMCREATGRAGTRRDFFITAESARNYLEDLNPSITEAPAATPPAQPSALERAKSAIGEAFAHRDGMALDNAIASLVSEVRAEEREACAKAAHKTVLESVRWSTKVGIADEARDAILARKG